MEATNGVNRNAMQTNTQVRIQLTTRNADLSLPESTGPILVPTNFRRYALSTLVNTLLKTENPVPLEFLINGAFLRLSLDEYLTTHGISAETVLNLEYTRATLPPSFTASFEHDDWISSIDIADAQAATTSLDRVASGSYDGIVRLWNLSSEVVATSPGASLGGHHSAVKSLAFLGNEKIVSGGMDRTIRIWKTGTSASTGGGETPTPRTLKLDLELYGHTASVDALCVNATAKRILSGSADHTVGVWSSLPKTGGAPAAPTELIPNTLPIGDNGSKRRRVAGLAVTTTQRGPLQLLHSHTAPVTDVSFATADHTVAYSVSIDHTLKTWDLPTGSCIDTRATAHSLLSLVPLPTLNLVAAGTSARHITLIDPRSSATTVSAMTLRGHNNAVVSLAIDPTSAYGLVSGSHDGACRVWDIRNTKTNEHGRVGESTYIIERESIRNKPGRRTAGDGIKVFAVKWDEQLGIVSAGEDKQIQINRVAADSAPITLTAST